MKRAVLCTLAITVALPMARAHADSPPHLDLAVVGDTAGVDGVGERVASWFRGLPTAVWTTRLDHLDPAAVLTPAGHDGVQVWIVVGDPVAAHIFFAVQAHGPVPARYLVSDVPIDSGLDEVGLEQIAQVAYLSSLALWAGTLESSRDVVEDSLRQHANPVSVAPVAVRRPSPPERKTVFALGPAYAVRFAGPVFAQLAGASVGAERANATTSFGVRLHANMVLPHDATTSGVQVELVGGNVALGGGGAVKVGRRTWLPAELGFGLDVIHYRAGMLENPALVPTNGGTGLQPVVFARAGARVDFGAFSFDIAAVLDVHLRRTHYDVIDDGREDAVITPWLVQPGVAAGFIW